MSEPRLPGEQRAGIARWFTWVEDVVYVGLGLLIAGLVALLLVDSFIGFGKSALAWTLASSGGQLLDQVLLILLLVELLYTVQVSFREHALLPEPFLLVGLISAIRRILVITATFRDSPAEKSPPPGLIPELAVLTGLIFVLAVSLVLVRRRDLSTAAPRST